MATEPYLEHPDTTDNENWTTCDRCGAKLFVDPETSQPELCSNCQSRSMKSPLVGGVAFIALGGFIVAVMLGLAIYMLMQSL